MHLQAIHVVDALNSKVLKNITTDQSGNPLTNAGSVGAIGNDTTRGWNDATYLEVRRGLMTWAPGTISYMMAMLSHHGCPMQDPSHGYVFVNEADIYQNPDGSEYSYVTVIDTRPQEVFGPRTSHTPEWSIAAPG
jgi:hypothetical protein